MLTQGLSVVKMEKAAGVKEIGKLTGYRSQGLCPVLPGSGSIGLKKQKDRIGPVPGSGADR